MLNPPSRQFAIRLGELTVGFLTWSAQDYAFDFVLYPLAIWRFGLWRGGLLMSLLSLLACLLLLRLYNFLGRDWLGIEFIKNQKHYEGPSKLRRCLAWLLKRGDGIAFIVLSLKNDAFITTAYLRHRAYARMDFRDWIIFMGSWLVSNAVWMTICFGGVSFLQWLV